MTRFLSAFAEKTKLVNMLTVLVLVMGLFAVQTIRREGFPKVDFEIVFVNTVYPGASPEDVEVNVTLPLEERLRGIDGLKNIRSVSRDGLSTITLTLEPDAPDPKGIKDEIQKAVDQVTDLPPEVVARPAVWELKTDNFAVLQIALSSNRLSEGELRAAGRDLKKRLERLSRVSRIELEGYRQREVQIQVDGRKLQPNFISLADVVNILRARNVRVPAGDIRDADRTWSVVTEAKFRDLEDVKNTILRTNFEGQRVRVRDIARVEDTYERYQELVKMNGDLGVTLNVLQKGNADTLRTVDQVRKATEAFRREMGDRLSVAYINDVSKATRSTLGIVVSNALLGMVLVVAVLLVFLDWRTAFWTTLGIPFALAVTLFLMVLGDVTLNTYSLIGLVIVLGMLVDDSIVIAESIYANRQRGLPPLEAARKTLNAVALPVLATVSTTIVAFLPFLLLPGILGKFIRPIPVTITVALLGSLFEAFFILPNHLSTHAIRRNKAAADVPDERRWFAPVLEAYGRALSLALHHRGVLFGLFVAILIGSVGYAATRMKFELFPQQSLEMTVFYLEAEKGTSLEKMDELTRRLERVAGSQPAGSVDSFTTQIARGRNDLRENENLATFTLYFPPAAEQKVKDPRVIVAEVKRELAAIPEFIRSTAEEQKYGPPVGSDLEVRLIGNDNARRAEWVAETERFLAGIEGVTDIENSTTEGKPELNLSFDFERLARYGLTAAEVGLALRTALEGTIVSRTFTPEERIDYRVLLEPAQRRDPGTLNRMFVTNQQRNLVPIRDLVRITTRPTIAKIDHYNGDRITMIYANVDRSRGLTPVDMNRRLQRFLAESLQRYPGFSFELAGEARESADTFRNVGLAFLLALVLIYFILVLQFNSFFQPLLIMFTIPFGIVGVIWTFAIHGLSFSFLAFISLVGLAGVVVNNAIVMVHRINTLVRERGCSDFEHYLAAALDGGKGRLRPILLTTITTVAGVLPTAYGVGGYVESVAPMVLGLGWGLLFSTVLTVFLVPGLYVLEVQLEMKLARWVPWLPLKTQCENPFAEVAPPLRRPRNEKRRS